MKRVAILGSGASAISAALYIFESKELNIEVDVIDFGLRSQNPISPSLNSSRLKSSAADHLFHLPDIFGMKQDAITPSGTAAFGGWAEVWGATIFPYSDEMLKIFEMDSSAFWASYSKIVRFISPSFREDDPNRKISHFISDILRKKLPKGLSFALSQLAISGLSTNPNLGCNQCGSCLSGCDYGHIWKPSNGWSRIFEDKRFNYLNGLWIDRVVEKHSKVYVHMKSPEFVNIVRDYDFVFCGLGSIQTAALMLRSEVSTAVEVRDSQMILIPFLGRKFQKTGDYESRIALSEGFISGQSPNSNGPDGSFFAQIYVNSVSLHEAFLNNSAVIRRLPEMIRKIVLSRLGVAMTFYDQGISGSYSLLSTSEGISLKIDDSNLNLQSAKRIARNCLRHCGLWALTIFSKVAAVGQGYHSGASFPMLRTNGQNSSDKLGRPNGLELFSIIDSSVLPRINSSPHTVNMMVNAHRISREISELLLFGD
jgi:hypothetical protein